MSQKIQPGYEYKGVRYLPDYDYEDDNMKIFHMVELDQPTGGQELVILDWSPYSTPTIEQFQTWVDLGMPGRTGSGPLDEDSLLEILKRKRGLQ